MEFNFDIFPHNQPSNELKNTSFIMGNGNRNLSNKIAQNFRLRYDCSISQESPGYFASGEVSINHITENIRQKDIVIIQSIVETPIKNGDVLSVNDLILEVLIMIDAVKRGSAKSITLVLPMYPYQRQDRKNNSRTPISARVMTTMFESLGVSRVIVFDLHADQIQGFFGLTPLDNLFSEPYFIKYIKTVVPPEELKDVILVSPDEGGIKRVVHMAKKMNLGSAFMYKERKVANEVENMVIMGKIENKVCIIIDDIIDTAGTACKAADILKQHGASKVIMCACHGIFSKDAIRKIHNSSFDRVSVTNTVLWKDKLDKLLENNFVHEKHNKIDIIDISKLASLAIERCLLGNSLSELFNISIT